LHHVVHGATLIWDRRLARASDDPSLPFFPDKTVTQWGLTMSLLSIALCILLVLVILYILNYLSYRVLKNRILRRQRWDLNICCGKTDGGGINADSIPHTALPHLVLVDVYHLPFKDGQFDTVLSSHTVEHISDPERFFSELTRVGRDVTLVLPPLWDVSAVLNVLEHRWIFHPHQGAQVTSKARLPAILFGDTEEVLAENARLIPKRRPSDRQDSVSSDQGISLPLAFLRTEGNVCGR
jgi:SAM-dependent methyltransferase